MKDSAKKYCWPKIIQFTSLFVCGMGALLFSPPNKLEMTSIEQTGAVLILLSTVSFLCATGIRTLRWLQETAVARQMKTH